MAQKADGWDSPMPLEPAKNLSEYKVALRHYYDFRRELQNLCQDQVAALENFFKTKNSYLNKAGVLTDMALIVGWLQPDKPGAVTFPISRSRLCLALKQSYQNHTKMTIPELPEGETVQIIMNALDGFMETQPMNAG